ncbi:hypothetical protein [Aeromicrobium sp. UC242_57]|uniref:hypothetical protein n=1 Tax=Aeromicrobium sp. UC242_57 TaxID=3374624 RepID=UPI0037C112D8
MFVKVRVGAEMLPAMSGAAAVPSGGLPLRLGPVLDAIGTWREAHLASRPPVGQIAAEVGVGSIVAGQPGKPDLLPAAVDIHAYVVMVDGDDAQRIGAELARHLQDRLAGTALAQCPVEVTVALEHPSAATPAAADVVQRAASAWLAERGESTGCGHGLEGLDRRGRLPLGGLSDRPGGAESEGHP